MPVYRVIYPPGPEQGVVNSQTEEIDSGEEIYKAGDVIELGGRRWQVSSAPLDDPQLGEAADLMVWPAD